MQFLAFRRFGNWFFEEFREMWGDIGSLFLTGLIVFAARSLFKVIGILFEIDNGVIAVIAFVAMWQLTTGFVSAALLSAAKARLHDRQPRFGDMVSDPLVILNAVGGQLIIGFLGMLPMLVLGIPAILVIVGVLSSIGRTDPGAAIAASTALMFLLGAVGTILSLLISTFFTFVVPLIVDKRVNCFKAIVMSARMAVRDYFGLLFFQVLWGFVYWFSFSTALCTCAFPFIFCIVEPALAGVKLRAYRDYFGLDRDWMLEESLHVEGYHELVRDLQEERASSVVGFSRSIYDKAPPGAAYPAPSSQTQAPPSSVQYAPPLPQPPVPPPPARPATQSPLIPPSRPGPPPPSGSVKRPPPPTSGVQRLPPPPGGGIDPPKQ